MSRYGITIKNPKFDGIGIYWKDDDTDRIKENLMMEKAKLAAFALKEKSERYFSTNDLSYIVRAIKQYLIILSVKKYESWVVDDKLYVDEVRASEEKWELEDSIKAYDEFITSDLEELVIFALLPPDLFLYEKNKDYMKSIPDVINSVKCDIDNMIKDMEETIDTYVANKIAVLNFDNIIKEKEDVEE